jgi:hypothetical protein
VRKRKSDLVQLAKNSTCLPATPRAADPSLISLQSTSSLDSIGTVAPQPGHNTKLYARENAAAIDAESDVGHTESSSLA